MTIRPDDMAAFKAVLDDKSWSTNADEIAPHLVEWRDRYQGRSSILLKPDNTEAVARIVRVANDRHVPLVVQGGNTGLVGGGVPDAGGGEVLLSLKRMTAVRDDVSGDGFSLGVEAGVTLQAVQETAKARDRLFPLSLASEGTATIGGAISTNAGGVHVLKYGTMRSLILGLEAVLPTGEIYHGLTRLHKDNTGYDLKSLLCGAEGTLGVVTAATLKLYPALHCHAVAFAGLKDVADALALLAHMQEACGDRLIAFELIPRFGLELVSCHMPRCRDPMETAYPWYVLMELASSNQAEDLDPVLEQALASAHEKGMVQDAVVAASEEQAEGLWRCAIHCPRRKNMRVGPSSMIFPCRNPEFPNLSSR